ncbi:MAG: HDOD domain-containing protein, partial [Desulfobacterota bacterium]|nr:HDOD domain-containing protein [Thermodesulfobacteriota bacterium]
MDERSIFPEVIKTLIAVIEEKDVFIRGHSLRVAQGCVRMAKRLGFTKPDQDRLFLAGLLHDIGMVYVPQELVAKTDQLSEEEMEVVKKHPLVAEKILAHLRLLQPVVPMIRHHHEWYDGSGYPDGLRGNDIPQGARILAIVDCYDALVSARPHRPAKTAVEAIAEMQTLSGTQFDPELFPVFSDLVASEATAAAPGVGEIIDPRTANSFAALVDKVRSGKIELPVLPAVVMDIQRVIKSPIATTQEVAAAIEKDAVISLRLIATANSPLYRGAKK